MQTLLYLLAVLLIAVAGVLAFKVSRWQAFVLFGAACVLLAYAWPGLATLG